MSPKIRISYECMQKRIDPFNAYVFYGPDFFSPGQLFPRYMQTPFLVFSEIVYNFYYIRKRQVIQRLWICHICCTNNIFAWLLSFVTFHFILFLQWHNWWIIWLIRTGDVVFLLMLISFAINWMLLLLFLLLALLCWLNFHISQCFRIFDVITPTIRTNNIFT